MRSIFKAMLLCICVLSHLYPVPVHYQYPRSLLASHPCLLIKIPTRSRPEQFFHMLDLYYEKLSGVTPYYFIITCDEDDATMNCAAVKERLANYSNLAVFFGSNKSKIAAYNADINNFDFDILVLASDDMEPLVQDYDKIIVQSMLAHFYDYDGVLHFNDGHVGRACNTLPIIGKKFYDRFGYAYHPSYLSLFCDEELTYVAKILRKDAYLEQVLFRHNHPGRGLGKWDELYIKNENLGKVDLKNFYQRQKKIFDIAEAEIRKACPLDWSILIISSGQQSKKGACLKKKINEQIKQLGLEDKIELIISDNSKLTIGEQRNNLLRLSKGYYINFIDECYDIDDTYVEKIYQQLLKLPDYVGFLCVDNNKLSVYSNKLHNLLNDKSIIKHAPFSYLNPMKRMFAVQWSFSNTNDHEDLGWTASLIRFGILINEEVIHEPLLYKN